MAFLRTLLIGLFAAGSAHALPWPGGIPAEVSPPGFISNVSGATWNPLTQTLWTTENNPGIVRRSVFDTDTSEWVVAQSWTPGSDLEAIAIRMFEDASIFVGVERDANAHRLIREYSVPAFTLLREWNLGAMRFGPANDGLEALTFVPDSILTAMQFVNTAGAPYGASQFGTGGLFFAGHQDTGAIYVFDLDRSGTGINRPHVHVATISTGQAEIAGLEFDRQNGLLYAWHDDTINKLQVFGSDGSGHFASLALFDNPFCCDWNIEGIALVDRDDCAGGSRSLLFTRDQDTSGAPSLYEDGLFPCDCNGNAVADAADIAAETSQDANDNGVPDECEPMSTSVAVAPPLIHPVLHPNFPNPFNPQTTIAFELPQATRIQLAIHDVAGNHVRTLVDGAVAAGRHLVPWDGRDHAGNVIASGVYFCQLRTTVGSQRQRLVCVR